MVLPLTSQECGFSILLIFIVMGFMRGWAREVISLVFILLAVCLVHPNTSDTLNCFLGRSGNFIAYVSGSSSLPSPTCYAAIGFLGGAFWSLLIFILLIALGYCIGNLLCPCPRFLLPRCLGVLPAVISGTIILFYLSFYIRAIGESASLELSLQHLNPGSLLPIVFVIIIIVLIAALIASCWRK
jgi:hypothetical protein